MAKRLEILLKFENTNEKKHKNVDFKIFNHQLIFPVNPEQIEISYERESNTYNILGYGEVHVSGEKKLKRITLKNILPQDNSYLSLGASLIPTLNERQYTLDNAKTWLKNWFENDCILRLVISDELNMLCKITKFSQNIKERTEDIDSTIELIEYKRPDYKVQGTNGELGSNLTKLKKRFQNWIVPDQLTAQQGMTIYKIAMKYGIKNWQSIAKLNNVYDANIDLAGKIIQLTPLTNKL